ncbi:aminotransferase class V-fold PLP-dependent enzyme [Variovorax sp. J22G73]|uniref:pyridoxal-phosphate-dependent aminotransferase family protein n=1 Tax=unclassified Variovorax TaxID=663243 RepID=UPI0025749A5D|nr:MULTISPECIES: aminotransferase class V-fold PLP-dependent enzyme [unclassified Variovorax]MDM0010012.1 aminotransferase class V-fold PLP-dependent enzyme [Variovorax sp. J22R203]MDM0102520.1 aminotransferase class V-fold PLP-dependent enzyme [Variovorax sp. J22G73]
MNPSASARSSVSLPRIPGSVFLHAPGPTRLPPQVVDAMGTQPLELGDPALDTLIANCEQGLRRVFGTARSDVFMYAANGHGAWEAAISNLAAPGECVVVVGSGTFSEAWALHAEGMGVRVRRTACEEGHGADPRAVEQLLRADAAREIVAVFVVHTDTGSGVTSDMQAFRDAIDAAAHPALLVVDVVASLAAARFDMDALRVDVAIGASQKALMVPPGLSFVAVNEKALRVAQANPTPRVYWDWMRRKSELSYRKFCGTPPQNLLMGLEAALGLVFAEGLAQVVARHRHLAQAVQAAVEGWSERGDVGFHVRTPAHRSVSVTTVAVRAGIDPEALRTLARERFQVGIAGGLGALAGKIFRIGHLGDLNAPMVLGCLAGVEAAMSASGIAYGPGVERAVRVLAMPVGQAVQIAQAAQPAQDAR